MNYLLEAFCQGRDARKRRRPRSSNPYPSGAMALAWVRGWEAPRCG